jgi:sulfur-carrier protein
MSSMAGGTGPGVTVLIPALLAPTVDGQREVRVPVDGSATVADLLDTIGAEYPVFNRRVRDETGALRRHVNLYVDGEEVRRLDGTATRVRPGQEVLLIQNVAGG